MSSDSSVFHFFNNSSKSSGVVESEVSENFAVDFDTALVDQAHELRVAEVVETSSSVDTLDPEGTEVALFVFAVAVCISKTFFPCVLGNGPYIFAAAVVSTSKL